MELLKGVHVIDSYATTTLLVDDRLILVDTAVADQVQKVLDYLSKIRMKPKDISTIFITHVHPDHIGGLATIKKDSPAKVVASKVEAEYIAKKRVYDGPPGAQYQKQPPTPVDVALDDGQVYEGLRAIYTPGHTRGSISLLDEARSLLLAGDAFRNEKGLAAMDDAYNVDPKQHRESIRKLAKFHFENAILGHGAPLQGGASAKVADLAKRL